MSIDPTKVQDLSADKLMSIRAYHHLFLRDELKLKQAYRKLAMKWHPDQAAQNPVDQKLHTEVFSHIKGLYEQATYSLKDGTWGYYKVKKFETKDSIIEVAYFAEDEIAGFGTQYTGRKHVVYYVPEGGEDFVNTWIINSEKMKAAGLENPDLGKIFEGTIKALPEIIRIKDGWLAKVAKYEHHLNLAHVAAKKKLPEKQVVWIISRLLNLACFMEIKNVPNLDICPRSIYVDMASHEIILADGWQYSTGFRVKALGASRKLMRLCPDFSSNHEPLAKHITSQIKAVGRELLGDPVGVTLAKAGIPKPFATWLNSPSETTSVKEFSIWDKVKVDSYGKPTFIHFSISEQDIY